MTKRPKFKRRQYKLNWLQILRRIEEAYESSLANSKFSQIGVTKPLDEAIEALRDRLDMPTDTHRKGKRSISWQHQ
jgi:hypothetical protein